MADNEYKLKDDVFDGGSSKKRSKKTSNKKSKKRSKNSRSVAMIFNGHPAGLPVISCAVVR